MAIRYMTHAPHPTFQLVGPNTPTPTLPHFFAYIHAAMSSTPNLSSKVILITGANNGIGKATALFLATLNPAQIWIAARNVASGHAAVAEIKAAAPTVDVRFVECDLASFDSVARAARQVVEGCGGRLDVLMLNAGIVCPNSFSLSRCLSLVVRSLVSTCVDECDN